MHRTSLAGVDAARAHLLVQVEAEAAHTTHGPNSGRSVLGRTDADRREKWLSFEYAFIYEICEICASPFEICRNEEVLGASAAGIELVAVEAAGGEGVSYFDRLWRAGAGTHSERTERFVIVARPA